jgi:BlaI family transcriptional regulator, penicillinase repressor
MSKPSADVTSTELAILDVLWNRAPCEIRDIVEVLYGEHTPARHATVKSLLERLTEKGYIESDTHRFAHKFSPTVTRESYVGRQLQKLADSHFDGALAPMLLTLLDQVKLNREERQAIRKIVENID